MMSYDGVTNASLHSNGSSSNLGNRGKAGVDRPHANMGGQGIEIAETEDHESDEYEYDDEGFDGGLQAGPPAGGIVNNHSGMEGDLGVRNNGSSKFEATSTGGFERGRERQEGIGIVGYRPNTLPASASTGDVNYAPLQSSSIRTSTSQQFIPPATSNIPLSSPDHTTSGGGSVGRPVVGVVGGSMKTTGRSGHPSVGVPVTSPLGGQSKLDSIRNWSFNTYKFTRQVLSEKLGRTSRTVDAELEAQIELLRDTQAKYANVLRLTLALSHHFHQVTLTQRALGDAFSDLSQKNPELREEFAYNSETQKILCRNGDTLLGALNFFTSTMSTLCNKTIEDTLLTVKQYEAARVEYDAYRIDLENLQGVPRDLANSLKVEDAQRNFRVHKEKFEQLRSDVTVKMKFLDENRVKVMHKQLLLLHNAVASYFSGNQSALEETLRQFNIKLKTPNSDKPSWLESRN